MEFLSVTQVATMLSTSHDTVLRMIHSGQLRGEKLRPRGRYRIAKDDLIAYAERQQLTLQFDKIGGNQ